MKIFTVPAVATLVMLAGCAHSMMRGSVAMKLSDTEAHVCMGDGEVKPGDKVLLFTNKCINRVGGAGGSCTKKQVGEGEIERVLNEHYSVMRVPAGTDFGEGTIVEKK